MELWWSGLDTTVQVFYVIAIATTTLLVLQFILMMLGFDGDGDLGEGALSDGDTGLLSVRTISAFFTGFGWTGVACLEAGWSLLPTLIASVAAGGIFMGGVVLTMRTLYGMRYSGTLDYRNAIGAIGVVYLKIPARMTAPGQIEVRIQGRLCVVEAFANSAEPIPNQTRVKVIDVMDDNTLVVETLSASTSKEQLT